MAVENTGSLISDLDPTLPRPDDYISEGDDHIRLIKHNLQYTFPNLDAVMSVSSEKLNQMDSYLEFTTTTSSGGLPKVNFQEPTLLSNGLNAVSGTDFPVLQQVKDLITTALQNSVYRVGSYYISDDSTNPLQVLGFGTWVRVSGFLAGAGSIPASDGIAARSLTAGQSGGRHAFKIGESQIPQMTASFTGKTSEDGDHIHADGQESATTDSSIPIHTGYAWGGTPEKFDDRWATGHGGKHDHDVSGSMTVGHANPAQVDNMPPFSVVNIWKRTA